MNSRLQDCHATAARRPSPDRFRFVALLWRHRRFAGDEGAYDLIETWRKRDLHLDQYELGLRRAAAGRRREAYRVAAARLSARYRTIIVDDTDLRDLAKNPTIGSDEPKISTIKHQQRSAAGSVLRGAMQNAFFGRCEKGSAAWMTRCCYQCGSVDLDWETRDGKRDHTCPSCNATWDRDANLCRNLIRERSRSAASTETARSSNDAKPKRTRQQRLHGAGGSDPKPEIAR
jgi:transposase